MGTGLLSSERWELLHHDVAVEARLVRECGVVPLVARTMAARGITTPDEANRFLSPSLERDWGDPLLIPGLAEAVERIDRALEAGETIAVFGDFDVDGMSATCLLTLALRDLGATVFPYIPNRFGEGYGLSKDALRRIRETCSPDLVVTVDNGIAARNEVAWLLEQGVDVVVTDHHEPAELVPQGVAVCDPKLEVGCASRELAGAGVALKIVQVLGERHGDPLLWRRYTEVATLGTISDMMLLEGENRALVSDGMRRMHVTNRPGIIALAATAGVDLAKVTADDLPFSLIPRLNAAGRMGSTDVAFDLLVTDDPERAAVLAGQLESINNERREIEAALSEAAVEKVEETYRGERAIVIGGEGWHEGVKGIVASRMVNLYHVPAILFSIADGVARGSGRSVGSVDLFHAVEQCSDLLTRFGGHAGAVGVTCPAQNLPKLRERLAKVMDALPAEQFVDKGEVAAMVSLDEMSVANIDALDVLQPFGQGNKKPLFGVRGVTMRNRSRVGAAGNHLRFVATDGISSVPAIMFRTPEIERASTCEEAVDLVFEPVSETWQGRTKPKLMVKDIVYRTAPEDVSGGVADELFEHIEGGASAVGAPFVKSPRRAVPAGMEGAELVDTLRRTFIGDHDFLPAQRQAIDNLGRGESTLCVMATGRGKSLIFHVHAALEALVHERASIFVYPLRALVADQSFHLGTALSSLGIGVRTLTGETPQGERARTFAAIASGEADVVLTTPEFLSIHAQRFAQTGRVGFVVIDEAHHAGMAKGGNRSAYLTMPRVLSVLGDPVTLAVSATADSHVAQEVCELLNIAHDKVVVDQSVRDNLFLKDCRELRDRDAALVSVVATGEKTVIYVNSREQSISLARMLRRTIPELGHKIAFYNAGLSRADRLRVEQAFRVGELSCIVSTSAFGEGVNLPDIRNVMLYHMPFGAVEFNQMSGRAGRDGEDAFVYLLFGARDAHINERIVGTGAPQREDMVTLYRTLVRLCSDDRAQKGRGIVLDEMAIVQASYQVDSCSRLEPRIVSNGIAVFEELGFVSVEGVGDDRRLTMVPSPARMDLERSIRYVEGQSERVAFTEFRDWVLSSSAEDLLGRINRPIVPGFGMRMDSR